MALFTFYLNPSADIHLILNPATRKTIQLDLTGFDDTTGHIGSVLSRATFAMADPSIASISSGGLLTAVKGGITFLTAEITSTPSNLKLVARIWVHDNIDTFYSGNNSATVHAGNDNLLLTMFAKFSKEDVEDVTAHPYFSFLSANTSIATVNSSGRVTGVAVGITSISITDLVNAKPIAPVQIIVKESLTTARPIVEKVSFNGYGPEKRNILFIAEGFKQTQRQKFIDIVRTIDRRMRTSILHEPFQLLRRDYNTWLAFEPSEEDGTNIGPVLSYRTNMITGVNYLAPVLKNLLPDIPGDLTLHQLIDLVGLPTEEQKDSLIFDKAAAITLWNSIPGFNSALLSDKIFDWWQTFTNDTKVRARNSALGLINGRRLGDRYAKRDDYDQPDNRWYRSIPASPEFFYKDFRNTGSRKMFYDTEIFFNNAPHLQWLWKSEFFQYLNSLSELSAATGGFSIGSKWNLHGDDQGLVMILVNTDYFLKSNYLNYPNIFGAVSIGNEVGIDVLSLNGPSPSDHIPADANISGKFMESIIATVIHELSHAINLGDEYEDTSDEGNANPLTITDVANVELSHNLNAIQNINSEGTKWEFSFFRMQKSSALISDSSVGTTPNTLIIDLFPGEGSKWSMNEQAILITKNLNGKATFTAYPIRNSHRFMATPALTIIDKTGDQLTVQASALTATTVFPKGSMLCIPKFTETGDPLKIHLPGVLAYLNNSLGLFPAPPAGTGVHQIDLNMLFSNKAGACAIANTAMTPTPYPIPHVSISESLKHRLLGLHEGAGTYNCGVVRATAVCKMRSQYMFGKGHFRFCHLCKYTIVQEFNPSLHSSLESQYPGRPS